MSNKAKQTGAVAKEQNATKIEEEALAQIDKQIEVPTPHEPKEAPKESEHVEQKTESVSHVQQEAINALYEKLDHMVKVNGVYYNAGDLIPKR